MVYQFRPGKFARGGVTAQQIGEECARLESENRLTAADLVEESRPADAPLHPAFEWNDAKAAEEWRLHQARNLINAVQIVVDGKEPVRAFFNLRVESAEYRSVEAICEMADERETLLDRALRDARAWVERYRILRDWTDSPIAPIFDGIQAAEERRNEP